MENNMISLEEKIEELEDRIYALERRESGRKVGKLLKTLFTVILIGATVYGCIKAYSYVTKELPKIIEEKVKSVKVDV